MSVSSIPDKIKNLLWGQAAGRCEYRGCNKLLGVDYLTKRPANLSVFAHIIADKPNGPRGNKKLSPKLKADISNLMLLCMDHHKMIDVDEKDAHSVELLREFKAEHEQRILWLTGIDKPNRTQIVLMEANIGGRKGLVNVMQAKGAVLPMYPVDDGFSIDLARLRLVDGKPIAWDVGVEEIDRAITELQGSLVRSGVGHVSVFALAPIPLLIYLGLCLGDIPGGVAHQRFRDTEDWSWKEPSDQDQEFVVDRPTVSGAASDVALLLSVSGTVRPDEIKALVPESCPVHHVRITKPGTDTIRSRAKAEEFRAIVRTLLAEIRQHHGPQVIVHLFPALPNSLAVEFGRSLLPKADPRIDVYDLRGGVFSKAITILTPNLS